MSTPTPQSNVEQYLSVIAGHDSEIPSEPSSRVEYFLNEIVENGGAGSGGEGTANYNSLSNKPKINGKPLIGNLTDVDLGLVAVEAGKGLSENDYTDAEKDKLSGIPADATNNEGTVTSVKISGAGPIEVSDSAAITTSGERVISHADSGVTAGSKGDKAKQTPGFGETFKALSATVDTKGHVTALGDHTVKVPSDTATTSKDGLMSKGDKAKLDAIGVTASAPLEVTKTGETYNVTLKDSGVTAGSKGDTTNQTPGFGDTFKVLSATVDAKGRLLSLAEHSVKTPDAEVTQNAKGLMSAADKKKLDNAVTSVKGDKEAAYRTGDVSLTPANIGAVPTSAVGVASGVAELDANGKVPSSQLPSYVDDVLEYVAVANFPATGESGKIYVATSTNLTYRWTGSVYTEISPSLALGETSSTAYRGDRGKIAYGHSQTTGNAHNMVKSDIGLGNVDNTSDADKPVSTAQQIALDSKVGKVSGKGLSTNDFTNALKNKLDGMEAGATATVIDDTLSNTGEAADAKATGDKITALENENTLLRELINGIDAPIYRTVSGNPATFADGYPANVKALSVTITPTQSGSGDPYPPGGGAQILRGTNDNSELDSGDSQYSWSMERWRIYSTGAGTRERLAVSDPPVDGIRYGFHLAKTDSTSGGIVGVAQNGVPYKAQTMTISFYAKGAGGRIRTGLSTPYYGYLTIPATTGWTRYAVSITPTVEGSATFSFGLQDENTEIYVCGLMMEYGETPSAWGDYSNVRPITGVSSVSVTRTGKNLWGGEKLLSDIKAAVPEATIDGDSISASAQALSRKPLATGFFRPNTRYTFVIDFTKTSASSFINLQIIYEDDTKTYLAFDAMSGVLIYTTSGNSVRGLYGSWEGGYLTIRSTSSGIFEGVITADAFEPYQRQTVTVTLTDGSNPLTVYGGTLDVTTGELTVTHGVYTFTGNETWTVPNEGTFAWVKDSVFANTALLPPDIRSEPEIICEALAPEPYLTVYKGAVANGVSVTSNYSDDINGRFCVSIDAYNNRSGLTGTKIVYRLANPVTYQLTPAQLATLSGYNSVMTDAGMLSVTYRADTVLSLGGGV